MHQVCLCAATLPLQLKSNFPGSSATTSFNLTKRIRFQAMLHSHTPTNHKWSLNGMTALVTGGTRGIGYKVSNFNAHAFFFL